jgi:electron transfer flavoprotein alpha subunit
MKAALTLFPGAETGRAAFFCYRILQYFKDAGWECEIWLFGADKPDFPIFEADAVFQTSMDETCDAEQILTELEILRKERKPDVLFFADDHRGEELCTRSAWRAGAGSLRTCTDVRLEENVLFVERTVYGGNVSAEFQVISFPFYMTLKIGEGEPLIPGKSYGGEIFLRRPLVKSSEGLELLSESKSNDNALSSAKIVFAAGRGFGGCRELGRLMSVAEQLGAEIGVTRPLVQNGTMPLESLIGTTGVSVFPDLLVAMGVSGSGPFMAGAKYARKIIAVNSDEDALIFKQSDIGVIADCSELLAMLEQLAK